MKHLIKVPLRKLAGPYSAHKAVYLAAKGTQRPLWRRFPDHALVLADAPSVKYESKEYDPSPRRGQVVRFQLIADVSVERGEPGKTRRIDPVLTQWIEGGKRQNWSELGFEIGRQWLLARQDTHGFKLMATDTANYEVIEFLRDARPIRIGTVDFSGIMDITDPVKFRAAMLGGIGHGKAWGLGLLLCRRVVSKS